MSKLERSLLNLVAEFIYDMYNNGNDIENIRALLKMHIKDKAIIDELLINYKD